MATRNDCCPGDPPGVMHSMDCPVYLASAAAYEVWRGSLHRPGDCGDWSPHGPHVWGAVSMITGPYSCPGGA